MAEEFATDGSRSAEGERLRRTQWLVLAAALLGWMFDGVEMGLCPIVSRSAMIDLLGLSSADSATIDKSVGPQVSYVIALFLFGAACGGLLFGWLGDRAGRVRAMALSILFYSCFTGACYFAAQPWQLAVLFFLAALGMGGEWALGVALVVESWPERSRPLLAGVIGAASNCGYLIIGLIVMFCRVTPGSWRWIMLACASPAVMAFLILAVVPESPRWRQAVRGRAARPLSELLGIAKTGTSLIRRNGPKGASHESEMSPFSLVPRLLLGIALASVALVGTWAGVHGFLPSWVDQLAGPENPHAKGLAMATIAAGAIIGSFAGAVIGGRVGRRATYFSLCLLSLAVCQLLFRCLTSFDAVFLATVGLAGFATASFYGWLPLYLPELFPTRVRATAQGLCYNSGRIFAMLAALGTGRLISFFDGDYPRACANIGLVYLIGMALIWWAPETRGKPLPD